MENLLEDVEYDDTLPRNDILQEQDSDFEMELQALMKEHNKNKEVKLNFNNQNIDDFYIELRKKEKELLEKNELPF